MEFATNSEQLVWLAQWTGVISVVLIFILMIQIFILRFLLVRRQKRAERFRAKWQPYLVECLERVPNRVPKLEKRDVRHFLLLWNYFHETLKDAGETNLNVIARLLDIDHWAIYSLKRGNIRERLLAIQTLGWLGEFSAWDDLKEIMEKGDPVVSLMAARALMRMDA